MMAFKTQKFSSCPFRTLEVVWCNTQSCTLKGTATKKIRISKNLNRQIFQLG
uniref:Uncharacterized protein n=1 Tax=Arundo donax TaxID=35708 RepID=A0A0A9G951_ARUDO